MKAIVAMISTAAMLSGCCTLHTVNTTTPDGERYHDITWRCNQPGGAQ